MMSRQSHNALPQEQCCLCGKNKEQVRKLIVGLRGAVCTDCIDLCNDLLHNEPAKDLVFSPNPGETWDGTVRMEPALSRVFGSEQETLTLLRAIAPLLLGNQAESAAELRADSVNEQQ